VKHEDGCVEQATSAKPFQSDVGQSPTGALNQASLATA